MIEQASVSVPASLLRDVVDLRRDFHAHPELGFEEQRTAGIVADRLRDLGYEVRTGVGKTGVVGVLQTKKPGKTVLLRADMDALPVSEQSGLAFASLHPGKMHACGHDGHVAILLGAAELIMQKRGQLCGTIVLCFQPAEEGLAGAKAMIADGLLEQPRVDLVYGLHLWNLLECGTVGTKAGPLMASSDAIEVTVRGSGGHGSAPHQTVDPIVTAASFVTSLQQVVSRTVDPLAPAVISIGSIHGGTTHNVIPDEVQLLGTVRTFSADLRDAMGPRIERTLQGCCNAAGATYDFQYIRRYPVTANDPEQAAYVRALAARLFGAARSVEITPVMGAEDFSFLLLERPGCFFFVGAKPEGVQAFPHHSARFAIDERALETGVQMMVALALDAPKRSAA
ncbi:MAG TPA: amidohydrolase [Candidatus Eremiobacteraceae bacterium]|nr:amidohydrolase [Candidatus Eremiobacteraceae bacterium]